MAGPTSGWGAGGRRISVTLNMAANTTEGIVNATMATKSPEEILYQSSGAIVAVIVIGVIIIFTLVLVTVKHCNRQNRLKSELAPKSSKHRSSPFPKSSLTTSTPISQISSSLSIPMERKY
ncbi:noncompact myelin-associated protein isoform X1 [Scyliorhinus torazame]|uniref:noncompact myelin-associated protein isoform X1 n=1 Tax=Scyliorhinus torazame TaxID=75743 RepID=UPI003B5C3E67